MENSVDKKVDVYMATLWRQGHAVVAINSLRSQPEFGTATITCNNWTDEQWEYINKELGDDMRIKLYRGNNEKGSNEKLKYIAHGNNYYIALADDDLIYPHDYLGKLINGCEKYNAYVSFHGIVLANGIINSYYRNRVVYRALGTVLLDQEVDIVGNCCSLFKRDFFNDLDRWYDFCDATSMDDIYVSYLVKTNGIKRYVLAHHEGYLKHKQQQPEDDYVFDRYTIKGNDKVQTDFVNKYFK